MIATGNRMFPGRKYAILHGAPPFQRIHHEPMPSGKQLFQNGLVVNTSLTINLFDAAFIAGVSSRQMPNASVVPGASLPFFRTMKSISRFLAGALLLAVGLAGSAQTATHSLVYSFTGGADSTSPAAALIQGGDGGLYGTTLGNIYPDYGSVFRITTGGTFSTIYTFGGITDSATPLAGVTQGADGNLYGSTYGNLIFGTDGSVFKLPLAGGTLTSLYSFSGSDGENPESPLTLGGDGNYYSTTSGGGSGYGTLYKISPDGNLTTVVTFNNFNGAFVSSPPILGSDGNYYGVTNGGGTSGFGTVYQLTPGGTLTTIYNFAGTGDGSSPAGPLVQGPDGNFYGSTQGSGADTSSAANGTIFKITPSGTLTTLHVFNAATEGSGPSGLFLASDGNLYGTTNVNGANNDGTIFKVTPSGVFTVLYTLTDTDGTLPQAGVVQANDGNLYGTAAGGGAHGGGGIFKVAFSPALASPVQVTSSAASVALGNPITLNWTVVNAFSKTMQQCYATATPATGATGWTGPQTGTYSTATKLFTGSATFTPAFPGIYTFGLTCGGVESGTAVVTIGDATALVITTQSIPTAYVGQPYSASIGVSGGVQPYTFSLSMGSLPAGLSLDAAKGTISGTPTAAAVTNVTVQVQDSDAVKQATASQPLAITVLTPLVIGTKTLPNDRIGTAYSQQLVATGGTTPYTWKLSPTSPLPAGLSMSASGLISGTPTVAGTSTFTVIVSDSGTQTANTTLTLTVDPLIVSSGSIALNPASITVGKTTTATLTLTVPPGSPTAGGSVQFQANGVNLGSPVAVSSGAASLTSGAFNSTGSYLITATYSGDPNYASLSFPAATLSVSAAPAPAIAITPSTLTLMAGQSGTVTAQVLNFTGTVTFTCANLPANVSCAFGTPSNGASTLTISTTNTLANNKAPLQHKATGTALACLLPAGLLMGFGLRRKRRWAGAIRLLPALALVVLAMGMTACAGKGSPVVLTAATGSTAVSVTATAGSATATTQFKLTIQ